MLSGRRPLPSNISGDRGRALLRKPVPAMLIVGDNRTSTLATCLEAASNFQLSEKAAKDTIARQIDAIRDGWDDICREAALTEVERNLFGQRIFLNDYIFEGTAEGL